VHSMSIKAPEVFYGYSLKPREFFWVLGGFISEIKNKQTKKHVNFVSNFE